MHRFLTGLISCIISVVVFSQNHVVVQAGEGKHTINKHIYGHFAEHLGHCIYGGLYVGENNAIPNTAGVRNDVIAALKKLRIPNLRWPGGCFADTYHWKDGIGPKDKRPSMVNRWWGGVTEDNSFGTHDFLNMCELLGAEPYLAANIASGTVQELSDWVQYVNSGVKNPMSGLRTQYGRSQPWKVTFWGVGNEAWGCGGNMTPEYYANEFRKYSTFMTDWTNSDKLFRVASGANVADYRWTETLMKNIPRHMMEGVALHHYSFVEWESKGSATAFTEHQYFKTIQRALFMDSLVINHSAIMDKYDPEKRIALVVDEWGGWYNVEPGSNPSFLYQQNTMRDAMIAGVTLNIFNNHCDRVRMANLAQTINVLQSIILTDKEKMILTPTYHVMEMYNVHHDARLLPSNVTGESYSIDGQRIPAVSVSASKDKNGVMHVSLVNVHPGKSQVVRIEMNGTAWAKTNGRVLVSEKIQDHNSFQQPDKIKAGAFNAFTVAKNEITTTLPPASVVVLTLE
jgi:alpha-L-arabinofuranosidase